MEARTKVIKAVVEGGKATGGPPLGPALGPLGVNIPLIVKRINELTGGYAGLRVPVEIIVNIEDKSFDVKVLTPTMSALVAKEAGISKGSGSTGTETVGDITMGKAVEIARVKREQLHAKSLKSAVRTVIGSCVSMGVTVDGKNPREVLQEIEEGKHDKLLSEK